MASTYTTKQGDAWDAIAFHVYGDVKYTGFLMQANFPHCLLYTSPSPRDS